MERDINLLLYDRQIRVFGVETQLKIPDTSVLLYGSWDLFMAELLKNIVLLGIKNVSLCLRDKGKLKTCLGWDAVGEAREIHPLAKIEIVTQAEIVNRVFDFIVHNSELCNVEGRIKIAASQFASGCCLNVYTDGLLDSRFTGKFSAVSSAILAGLCIEEITELISKNLSIDCARQIKVDEINQNATISQ